jgi:hypothetical protein
MMPFRLILAASAALLAGCAANDAPKAGADSVATADTAVTGAESGGSAVVVSRAEQLKADSAAAAADSMYGKARDTTFQAKVKAWGERMRLEGKWPVEGPAPLPGSLLPGKRILAYYGNPLSKRMGVLGEYEPEVMLKKLDAEVARWQKADPATPVVPALHMVAIVAQGAPGRDGKYRLKMDSAVIEKVYGWAKSKNALFFVDVQVGHSTLQEELPWLKRFLTRPDVHLGIDPEFSMHYNAAGKVPGSKIGTFDASDINYASKFLQDIVTEHKLPPKVLVVHRFTRNMVRNASQIKLDPRVQIVIDMDGWGPPWLKLDTYRDYVYSEPVQFTGFKIFYHNDTKKQGSRLMTPQEVLSLWPIPAYIQYQ